MRTAVLIMISALALGACDAVQNPFAKQEAKPATPSTVRETVTAPIAPPTQGEEIQPANGLPGQPPPLPTPVAATPAAPQVVRWSPADYAKRERRLAALIANAETRDTLGDTRKVAEDAYNRRLHCATRACIERAYADEEAWLRQWEGSGDVH